MNKRKRKKWLKKHGKYVPHSELWNLDNTICEWIVPRLKEFKKINIAYPGVEPWETPEKWDAALDQLIETFELLKTSPIDLMPYDAKWNDALWEKITTDYNEKTMDGLELFKNCFRHLWI